MLKVADLAGDLGRMDILGAGYPRRADTRRQGDDLQQAEGAVMNPVEKVMINRNSHVKLALAVVALVLVLWVTGSPLPSLWITPVVIVVLWTAMQLRLGYRHRRHSA